MPPTFFLFLAFMFYLWATGIALLVSVPMLIFRSTRLIAKKVLITVLISLPCLLAIAILIGLLFLLPALLFSWIVNNNYISKTPGIILAITGLLCFVITVAVCALYAWYFFSQVIYKLLDNKPADEFLDSNKVFKYMQRHIKLKTSFFHRNGIIKITCILVGIPLIAAVCGALYLGFSDITDEQPTQHDLVGKYHISKVTVPDFHSSALSSFKLEFKADSTFNLTSTPFIHTCEHGNYEVDYHYDYNEITLRCGNESSTAHIDRHWGYYRIEFIVGDPDSGESVYFEKDK